MQRWGWCTGRNRQSNRPAICREMQKKDIAMAEEGNHLEEDEVVGVHHLLAEHHRQELVEGDVLDQGRVDVASLLERSTFMALPRI